MLRNNNLTVITMSSNKYNCTMCTTNKTRTKEGTMEIYGVIRERKNRLIEISLKQDFNFKN